MKNKMLKLALLLVCSVATPFAASAIELDRLTNPTLAHDNSIADSVIYFKVESNDNLNQNRIDPDFGLGYRQRFGHHAVDVSATSRWGSVVSAADLEEDTFEASSIKVGSQANYLYYFTPVQTASFYAGGGIGNEHIRLAVDEEVNHFGAINALATFGYQTGLNESVSTFVQAQISQPASTYLAGDNFSFANSWQPTLTFTAGIGF